MENAQPEPSMEEILASIRRIISEDEEEGGAEPASTEPETVVEPAPVADAASDEPSTPAVDESVLTVVEDEPAAQDAANPHLETEDVEMVKKNVTAAIQEIAEDTMLDQSAAAAASKSFQNLSQSLRISNGDGRTLEDIVVEMVQPLVKQWLDENLPSIVEEKVEEEVQRVARRRG